MINIKTILTLLGLIFMIYAVSFFAGSETAYLSITKIKMKRLASENRRGAKRAFYLKSQMDELLTVVLVGTNFMNTFASALGTSLAIHIAGSSGVGIATAVISFASTIFGQIIPKTISGVYPEKIACRHSFVLLTLEKVFYPIVWLFSKISKFAGNAAEKLWKNDGNAITEEELKTLIDVGEKEGTLDSSESKMLNKIFEFSDIDVHKIMKHRSLVQSVPLEATKQEVVKKFQETNLKMIAVYEETPENVVGVIHYKSVLFTSGKAVPQKLSYAQAVMKGVMFVPETFSALELLQRFKRENAVFAVVLDEQGCTAGVVTMDDVMRVIFGRIVDEGVSTVSPEQRIKIVSPHEFIVPGDMKIEDLNAILSMSLSSEEFTTAGGWLLEQFGSLPSTGELLKYDNKIFQVEEQAQRRILKIRIKLRF